MAVRKKRGRKRKHGARRALLLLALLAGLVGGALGVGAYTANTVRVRRADIALEDLPPALDGATLLYASDIDLCGWNTPEKSAALFARLQSLRPDILLLGGDYTSPTVFDTLNSAGGAAAVERQVGDRARFFRLLAGFEAPLGKFAVAAPEDLAMDALAAPMEAGGIRLLDNARAAVQRDGATLWLAGVTDAEADLSGAASAFRRGDCVIAAAYSPAAFPQIMIAEASDSGRWADLALAGHTHGGQIRLFGRSAIQLSFQEQQYLAGWTTEAGIPMLTTAGVGCEGANLRFGSRPEVWLITLRRPDRAA